MLHEARMSLCARTGEAALLSPAQEMVTSAKSSSPLTPPRLSMMLPWNQGCQMAKFDPFLSLDCARVEGVGAQSKERKGSNFAA